MAEQQIGRIASLLGVSVETVRYYERCGLLDKPTRTSGNYRVYSEQQVERLKFILNCRNLDMTHDEIRRLLRLRQRPPKDCTEVNAIIDEHIAHIDERIAELRQLSKHLHQLRISCNQVRSVEDCKIMSALGAAATSKKNTRISHVRAHKAADVSARRRD